VLRDPFINQSAYLFSDHPISGGYMGSIAVAASSMETPRKFQNKSTKLFRDSLFT